MVAIPFPVETSPGIKPSEGAGRLINCRASALGEGARARAARHRVPGLTGWGTSEETNFRSALLVGNTLYVAYEDTVVSYSSSGGAASAVDDLDGTDVVFWARNNKRPTADIMIVCGAGTFTLSSGTIASLGDSDLPSANAICFLDGYFFITIADGRCFATGLNATTVNSNDFATTEAKADTLLRPVPWLGQLLLCGDKSIEVWANTANPTGFPFSRSAVIQRGIASQEAITGFEDGFGKGLFFVGDDNGVHQLNGYQPDKISTPDLERLIEAVSDKTTIRMCCYIVGGDPVIVVRTPDWCWEFNLNTRKWNERASYLSQTWKASRSINAFGKWLCGTDDGGDVLEIASSAADEVGQPLISEVWSSPAQQFPNRIRVGRADFDFAMGVGFLGGLDPNQTNPTVEISYSDDGGYSFSNPKIRKIGAQGKPTARVTLFNNGTSGPQGRIWKVRQSDPVHFGLMGGEMSAELKAG